MSTMKTSNHSYCPTRMCLGRRLPRVYYRFRATNSLAHVAFWFTTTRSWPVATALRKSALNVRPDYQASASISTRVAARLRAAFLRVDRIVGAFSADVGSIPVHIGAASCDMRIDRDVFF